MSNTNTSNHITTTPSRKRRTLFHTNDIDSEQLSNVFDTSSSSDITSQRQQPSSPPSANEAASVSSILKRSLNQMTPSAILHNMPSIPGLGDRSGNSSWKGGEEEERMTQELSLLRKVREEDVVKYEAIIKTMKEDSIATLNFLEERTQALEASKNKASSLASELEDLTKALQMREEEIARKDATITGLQESIEGRKIEMQGLSAEISDLKKKLKEEVETREKIIRSHELRSRQLELERAALQKEKEEAELKQQQEDEEKGATELRVVTNERSGSGCRCIIC